MARTLRSTVRICSGGMSALGSSGNSADLDAAELGVFNGKILLDLRDEGRDDAGNLVPELVLLGIRFPDGARVRPHVETGGTGQHGFHRTGPVLTSPPWTSGFGL